MGAWELPLTDRSVSRLIVHSVADMAQTRGNLLRSCRGTTLVVDGIDDADRLCDYPF